MDANNNDVIVIEINMATPNGLFGHQGYFRSKSQLEVFKVFKPSYHRRLIAFDSSSDVCTEYRLRPRFFCFCASQGEAAKQTHCYFSSGIPSSASVARSQRSDFSMVGPPFPSTSMLMGPLKPASWTIFRLFLMLFALTPSPMAL